MKSNWKVKKLWEVCEVFADGDWIEKKDQSSEGIRLIQTGNVGAGIFKDRVAKARYISEKTFERLRCTEIIKGDCLISRLPDPVGRACILPDTGEKMITAVDCTIIRFDKRIVLPEWFLNYSLSREYQIQVNEEVSGATRQRISRKNLGLIKIPFPSLPTQKLIISILDKSFEKISKAKENAEKNLKNAQELFESHLQSVFENKGEGWDEKTLAELSKKKNAVVSGPFGSNLKVSDYKDEGIPILRLQNIGKGYFIDKSIKYINKEKAEELKYHSFVSGDIVLAKLGIPIGKTCIIPNHFKSGIITADVVRIRPDSEVVNYKFLEYFLNTNLSVAQLTSNISGATRPRVNLSDVRNIKLNLPSLSEQLTILKKLDTLSAETKKLEAIYQRKLNDLEELKKAILQKAFNGELTE